jgi:hypothetical protein
MNNNKMEGLHLITSPAHVDIGFIVVGVFHSSRRAEKVRMRLRRHRHVNGSGILHPGLREPLEGDSSGEAVLLVGNGMGNELRRTSEEIRDMHEFRGVVWAEHSANKTK